MPAIPATQEMELLPFPPFLPFLSFFFPPFLVLGIEPRVSHMPNFTLPMSYTFQL
jgi:hypothetical protein